MYMLGTVHAKQVSTTDLHPKPVKLIFLLYHTSIVYEMLG